MTTHTQTYSMSGSDNAADMLDAALCVTGFLRDIAPLLTSDGENLGLSEKGACGLMLIVENLYHTIEQAANAAD